MNNLALHEQAEMQVLDLLRRQRVSEKLAFGGGTMLRLCYDLPRYSSDLDFYLLESSKKFAVKGEKLHRAFQQAGYQVLDRQERFHTFLWELRVAPSPHKLTIEIRKEELTADQTQGMVAHSAHSPLQVRLPALTLPQMWENKVAALIDRREARDAYDLEFLTRRGAGDFSRLVREKLAGLDQALRSLTKKDFQIKLGAVLPPEERALVISNQLAYLKSKIAAAASTSF